MSKIVIIKLTKAGTNQGPFLIKDEFGNIIVDDVSRQSLANGISYTVADNVTIITLSSKGGCVITKSFPVGTITEQEYQDATTITDKTSCMWKHLAGYTVYNKFYDNIHPYVIEYPFAYQYQDEILQNVKDYTKSYKYLVDGFFDDNSRIEVDGYFNKAVLYNNQQSTGMLILQAKPKNNLAVYSTYPKFNTDSKTILYTKSDNFYNYNTFWSIVKDKTVPLFTRSCVSMSIDKIINQSNMDYTTRSFNKAPLRAKDLKIRHILDNTSDLLLVSQMII